MRQIKFRAWDKELRIMNYGPEAKITFDGRIVLHSGPETIDRTCYELMQFTGLHDKNGKEIYEGDILECRCDVIKIKTNEPTGDISIKKYKIEYQTEYSRFQTKNIKSDKFENLPNSQCVITQFYSVIGNEFENQELLDEV